MESKKSLLDSFMESPNTECFVLPGKLNRQGYMTMYANGVNNYLAHKYALETKLGRKLENKEVTRHLCHNRACCNPNHLDVGSQKDNVRDTVLAGRFKKGKEPTENILKVKAAINDKLPYKEIAEQYSVSLSLVKAIAVGRLYK